MIIINTNQATHYYHKKKYFSNEKNKRYRKNPALPKPLHQEHCSAILLFVRYLISLVVYFRHGGGHGGVTLPSTPVSHPDIPPSRTGTGNWRKREKEDTHKYT